MCASNTTICVDTQIRKDPKTRHAADSSCISCARGALGSGMTMLPFMGALASMPLPWAWLWLVHTWTHNWMAEPISATAVIRSGEEYGTLPADADRPGSPCWLAAF